MSSATSSTDSNKAENSDTDTTSSATTATSFSSQIPPSFDPFMLFHFFRQQQQQQQSHQQQQELPRYLTLLNRVADEYGIAVLAGELSLDCTGFGVLHHLAGLVSTSNLREIFDVVSWLLAGWDKLYPMNSTRHVDFLCSHPLVNVRASPNREAIFKCAMNAGMRDDVANAYITRVLSMNGYTPLGIAARAGNIEAINIFITKLNANPFTPLPALLNYHSTLAHVTRIAENEIHPRNCSPLTIALNIPQSLHAILHAFSARMARNPSAIIKASNGIARILDPKLKSKHTEWPELIVLGSNATEQSGYEAWDVRDAYGTTPLQMVVACPFLDDFAAINVIDILLSYKICTPYHRDICGRTIVITAILHRRSAAFLQSLLNSPHFNGQAPLELVATMRKLHPRQFSLGHSSVASAGNSTSTSTTTNSSSSK
ncbi:hypothetical protein HK100_000055, partial [Physocladia obscura]